MTSPNSIYLHIPFCQHKCGYCDFNTYAGLSDLIPAYVDALVTEIEQAGGRASEDRDVHTIFFGGGTPSLLTRKQVDRILKTIRRHFLLTADTEITLEANPGTVNKPYLSELRQAGVNRISMGVQSSQVQELLILERTHGYADAIQAVRDCRQAGFENVSLDLIFGLPGQELTHWRENLERAMALSPEHISLYALTIEHGTPLASQIGRGLLMMPDPDRAADMYEWTQGYLKAAGFEHYEISNWAKTPSYRARHNLQYWQGGAYFGFGAGAHGYVAGVRTANVLSPAAYIKRLTNQSSSLPAYPRTAATVATRRVDRVAEIAETLMLGLRLLEGYSLAEFTRRFGESFETRFASEVADLRSKGLLEISKGRVRLTNRGLLLANQVFSAFV